LPLCQINSDFSIAIRTPSAAASVRSGDWEAFLTFEQQSWTKARLFACLTYYPEKKFEL